MKVKRIKSFKEACEILKNGGRLFVESKDEQITEATKPLDNRQFERIARELGYTIGRNTNGYSAYIQDSTDPKLPKKDTISFSYHKKSGDQLTQDMQRNFVKVVLQNIIKQHKGDGDIDSIINSKMSELTKILPSSMHTMIKNATDKIKSDEQNNPTLFKKKEEPKKDKKKKRK